MRQTAVAMNKSPNAKALKLLHFPGSESQGLGSHHRRGPQSFSAKPLPEFCLTSKGQHVTPRSPNLPYKAAGALCAFGQIRGVQSWILASGEDGRDTNFPSEKALPRMSAARRCWAKVHLHNGPDGVSMGSYKDRPRKCGISASWLQRCYSTSASDASGVKDLSLLQGRGNGLLPVWHDLQGKSAWDQGWFIFLATHLAGLVHLRPSFLEFSTGLWTCGHPGTILVSTFHKCKYCGFCQNT